MDRETMRFKAALRYDIAYRAMKNGPATLQECRIAAREAADALLAELDRTAATASARGIPSGCDLIGSEELAKLRRAEAALEKTRARLAEFEGIAKYIVDGQLIEDEQRRGVYRRELRTLLAEKIKGGEAK